MPPFFTMHFICTILPPHNGPRLLRPRHKQLCVSISGLTRVICLSNRSSPTRALLWKWGRIEESADLNCADKQRTSHHTQLKFFHMNNVRRKSAHEFPNTHFCIGISVVWVIPDAVLFLLCEQIFRSLKIIKCRNSCRCCTIICAPRYPMIISVNFVAEEE